MVPLARAFIAAPVRVFNAGWPRRSGFSGADEDSPLGEPERYLCLLGTVGRNVVVAAIRPDLVACGEWEEPPVPALRLDLLERTCDYRDSLLGIKWGRWVSLGNDLRIVASS
jgi:hypothetical protein